MEDIILFIMQVTNFSRIFIFIYCFYWDKFYTNVLPSQIVFAMIGSQEINKYYHYK